MAATTKKVRVVLAQPAAGASSPPPPPPRPKLFSRAHGPVRGTGEEAAYRARLRYQALLQDYQELLKEAEAKKRRLHMERLGKQRVLAEVRFLRKRYKSMSENPSQTIICRVRNRAMPSASGAAAWPNDAQHGSVQATRSSSRSQQVQWRQDASPRVSPGIDLNEACEPGYEEMETGDQLGYREPLRIDKVRRYPMEGDASAGPSEVRIPTLWDARSQARRAGKRKISWQDQLALRV